MGNNMIELLNYIYDCDFEIGRWWQAKELSAVELRAVAANGGSMCVSLLSRLPRTEIISRGALHVDMGTNPNPKLTLTLIIAQQ